jgi:hypothetical protein
MWSHIVSNILLSFMLLGSPNGSSNASDGYEALYRAISPYGFGYFYSYDYPFGYAYQLRNERRQNRKYREYPRDQKRYWYNFGNERLRVYRPYKNYRHMHPQNQLKGQRNSPVFRNRFSPDNYNNRRFTGRWGD